MSFHVFSSSLWFVFSVHRHFLLQKFFIFMTFTFLHGSCLWCAPKKLSPYPRSSCFPPLWSSISISWRFIFKPVIHFELNCCEGCIACVQIPGVGGVLVCFLYEAVQLPQHYWFEGFCSMALPLLKMSQMSLSQVSWLLLWVSFWALSSVALSDLSILLSAPPCRDHRSFTVTRDFGSCQSFNSVLPQKLCWF